MSPRPSFLFQVACAVSLLMACAQGAPAMAPGQKPADPTRAVPVAKCGDGVKDATEECDCPPTVTTMCAVPAGVTCESMSLAPGTLYCDPRMCKFIKTMCGATPSGGAAGMTMPAANMAGRGSMGAAGVGAAGRGTAMTGGTGAAGRGS